MSPPNPLQRFILWDFPRASWQYDIIVVLILAFIFVTPRLVNFRDQPRQQQVVMLPSTQGASLFWMEPDLLNGVPESQRLARASELVRRYHNQAPLIRLEPISDPEGEVRGYVAYTKP